MIYPKVSIVVPAYNEEKTIEGCIQSLLGLTYPKNKYEILIVDNNSNDKTAKIIQEYDISYLKETKPGPSAARNLGIKKAKGEIIAFIDADCVVDKNWLKNLVKGFDNPKIVGSGGKIKVFKPLKMIEKYADRRLYNQKQFIQGIGGLLPFLATVNCADKAEVFKKIGLFDPSFTSAEDNDFGWRIHALGYKFSYVSSAIVFHQMSKSFIEILKKQFIYGRDNMRLLFKHQDILKKESRLSLFQLIERDFAKFPHWLKKIFRGNFLMPFLDFLIYLSFRLGMIYQLFKIKIH